MIKNYNSNCQPKRNKYLGSWAAQMLKNMEETEIYIKRSNKIRFFKEPGDKDVIKKIKIDFDKANLNISRQEIEKKDKRI